MDRPAFFPLHVIALLLLLGSPLGLLASLTLAAKPLWDFLDDCYPVRWRAIAMPVGLPLASWALAFTLFIKDPGGVWDWFFD
jgi:hypothetical protein